MTSSTFLGRVGSVAGSMVSVRQAESVASGIAIIDGRSYRVAQVGSFVRIPQGYHDLYGIISEVGASATPETVVDAHQRGESWMTVQLVGEIVETSFERGISQYPGINDEVHLVTEGDLGRVYGVMDDGQITIGRLAGAESIPVHIDLDRLVTRHSAVLGSTELTLNGHEQATLAILENLYKAPRNRDALFNSLGIEKGIFNRCVTLGTSSGIVAQHTARGKNILISPYYFADNLEGLADLVAGTGTPALESTLNKVKSNQGWPLSLIAATGEIGGVKLSVTEVELVEKLAAEGIVKPPTIKFGGKTESFLFTPKPGSTRLNAANREIYERAMALISAVRKGQLLPDAYRIRSPVRILESLRDTGYLRSNSEARDQYHNLVVLRVAHLKQTALNRWQLHLNRTEENEAALKLAIQLLRSGTMANMEVDQEARIALSKGEEYIQSLISSAEMKKRQKQVTDAQAAHEFEQLILKLD